MASEFTVEGVESLVKMKQLKYIYFQADNYEVPTSSTILFVDIAGRVPKLNKFDFESYMTKDMEFVQMYGQLYPDKNLLMHHLR
jgi:hypothetical protein